jgi:hypothetical protein
MDSPDSQKISVLDSSASLDDYWTPAERIIGLRLDANRNYIQSQLKSFSLPNSTRAQMEAFLATPRTSAFEADLITLTSSNSLASSILQLLSLTEKNRLSLKKFTPASVHSFLSI